MNYWKVAAGCPEIQLGDVEFNVEKILEQVKIADKMGVNIMVFPQLSITGYTCGDLFRQTALLNKVLDGIDVLKNKIPNDIMVTVGAPIYIENAVYDCAVSVLNKRVISVSIRENGDRWFANAAYLKNNFVYINGEEVPVNQIIKLQDKYDSVKIGIEIGTDSNMMIPVGVKMASNGAEIILNLNAKPEIIGQQEKVRTMLIEQSRRCAAGYIYASAGINESTTDSVYSGKCYIAENGHILKENAAYELMGSIVVSDIDIEAMRHERASRNLLNNTVNNYGVIVKDVIKGVSGLNRDIDPYAHIPSKREDLIKRCVEISDIQVMGLVKRLKHIHCNKVVLGVSGGLDSTLALLVAYRAFDILGLDKKNIIGITMPGLGTSKTTKILADDLMEALGITSVTIDIKEAAKQHLRDIGHNEELLDVTFENAQARERTQILMDYANMIGGFVLGTGDLSEAALGWCTYNGDHISMYNVNASIPKSMVKYLVNWYKDILNEKAVSVLDGIVNIPISPELLPADKAGKISQKTEEIIGPYELHDFFLYRMLRFGDSPKKILMLANLAFDNYKEDEIKKWLKVFYTRFFNNQFKRSCVPDGVGVGSMGLSPRENWKMPSDASYYLWMKELD